MRDVSVVISAAGIRAMLNLVWSKESAVKEAVVKAYRRLYLEPRGDNPRSGHATNGGHPNGYYYSVPMSIMSSCPDDRRHWLLVGARF